MTVQEATSLTERTESHAGAATTKAASPTTDCS
jgi:hypothetical protein